MRVALSALAFHLYQDPLSLFLEECRRSFASGGPDDGECWITLVVDEWDGIYDMSRLATRVDVLSFSPQRRGFGVARSTAVQEARMAGARWAMVVDADGQHDPQAMMQVLSAAEASDWDAAIPQRTTVDLPLMDAGDLDRKAAERFEGWFVARQAGREDLSRCDMQPGVFLFGRAALDLLVAEMKARDYSWDLEATWRLMKSGLRLGFPTIETRPQATTFFSTEDSRGNFRFLARISDADTVRREFELFRGLDWVRDEIGEIALGTLQTHLAEALP